MRRVDLTFSALLLPLDFAAFMAASYGLYPPYLQGLS